MIRNLAATAHELLSTNLLVPLSRLQRIVRPSRREVMRFYYEGMRLRNRAEGWEDDRKADWILQRLRFVVRRAYRETIFYREQFDGIGFDPNSNFSFDDFSRLPVLERDTVHKAGGDLLSTRLPFGTLLKDSTGGSTGAPTEIWLGPEERGWKDLRLLSSAGNTFKRDYHAETPEGHQMPMVTVFQRRGKTIRHFWSSEMFWTKSDPGQDPRHTGTIELAKVSALANQTLPLRIWRRHRDGIMGACAGVAGRAISRDGTLVIVHHGIKIVRAVNCSSVRQFSELVLPARLNVATIDRHEEVAIRTFVFVV